MCSNLPEQFLLQFPPVRDPLLSAQFLELQVSEQGLLGLLGLQVPGWAPVLLEQVTGAGTVLDNGAGMQDNGPQDNWAEKGLLLLRETQAPIAAL